MEFPICDKHKKIQKSIMKVNSNGYICMNRYCPDSFKVFCQACKNDHRDHHVKVLSVEDTIFLIQRMQKHPFKESNRYIAETVDVMKKLKLIKQFRKKIDILEKQTQKETLQLLNYTQSLLGEYNSCKEGVDNLSEVLKKIDKAENYQYFFSNSQQMLSNLDYNFKKDKFQYGNLQTKEKEDKRRKTLDSVKRKVEEVRDYSMKIIEVILNNCESDSEEEDNSYMKKHYEVLRNELFLQKNQQQLDQEISELKNSKSTSNYSRVKKMPMEEQNQSTENTKIAEIVSEYQQKIKDLQQLNETNQNTLRQQLSSLQSEKKSLISQINGWKSKYEEKRKGVLRLEQSLRQNKSQRQHRQKSRKQLVDKIIDLWQWKGLNSEDKAD